MRRAFALSACSLLIGLASAGPAPVTRPASRPATRAVDLLIDQAEAYLRQRDYANAVKAAEEAFKLDPSSTDARILRDLAEMCEMRVKVHPPKGARDHDIREQLGKPVTFDFRGTPFVYVIDFLADSTGVNILLDPVALAVQRIGLEPSIKLKLSNVRLETALKLLLEQVKLDFEVTDNGILVSDAEGLAKVRAATRSAASRPATRPASGPATREDDARVKEKVERVVAQATEYLKNRQYQESIKAAEEALKLDPTCTEARILRDQYCTWSVATTTRAASRPATRPAE